MESIILPWMGIRQPFSAVSHWCAFLWMVYLSGILFRLSRHNVILRRGVTCFGVCASLLYGSSAMYHTVSGSDAVIQFWRLLDFSAIFLLIAGTWTAVFVVLPVRLRRTMVLLVWTVATLGIAGKWFLPMNAYPVTIGLYVLLALLGLLPFRPLIRSLGSRGALLGITGGLCYLIGGICDALKWPVLIPDIVHSHELLHILDLFGTMFHVILVFHILKVSRHIPHLS